MSALDDLKAARSLHDVATMLGYKPSTLAYILYRVSPSDKYRKFQVAKANGGHREIAAPIPPLKTLQRRLAALIQTCQKEIEDEVPQRSLSHGFRHGHSTFTNARPHKRKRYVLNLDLKRLLPILQLRPSARLFYQESCVLPR